MTQTFGSAFDVIKDNYDLDTLREIADHGCASGEADIDACY